MSVRAAVKEHLKEYFVQLAEQGADNLLTEMGDISHLRKRLGTEGSLAALEATFIEIGDVLIDALLETMKALHCPPPAIADAETAVMKAYQDRFDQLIEATKRPGGSA